MRGPVSGLLPPVCGLAALCLTAGATSLCLAVAPAAGEPVRVRFAEGVGRGFPVIRDLNGRILARGDFTQVARDGVVESRMTFRFNDGSFYDETTVFAQTGVFKLLRYEVTQLGPSFPETIQASMDRQTRRVHVRYREDADSPEEVYERQMDLPADLYNGMFSVLLKNLDPGRVTVAVLAFTPRPTIVKIELNAGPEEPVVMGAAQQPTRCWTLRPQLGLLASLLVSDPPDARVWILTGAAPAFLRFEGPLYFMGPVWRIETSEGASGGLP
jgi:hypothetical protein